MEMAEEKQIWGGGIVETGGVFCLIRLARRDQPRKLCEAGAGFFFSFHRSMKEAGLTIRREGVSKAGIGNKLTEAGDGSNLRQDGVVLVGQSAREQSSVWSNKLDI
jgi:hypothetical protein